MATNIVGPMLAMPPVFAGASAKAIVPGFGELFAAAVPPVVSAGQAVPPAMVAADGKPLPMPPIAAQVPNYPDAAAAPAGDAALADTGALALRPSALQVRGRAAPAVVADAALRVKTQARARASLAAMPATLSVGNQAQTARPAAQPVGKPRDDDPAFSPQQPDKAGTSRIDERIARGKAVVNAAGGGVATHVDSVVEQPADALSDSDLPTAIGDQAARLADWRPAVAPAPMMMPVVLAREIAPASSPALLPVGPRASGWSTNAPALVAGPANADQRMAARGQPVLSVPVDVAARRPITDARRRTAAAAPVAPDIAGNALRALAHPAAEAIGIPAPDPGRGMPFVPAQPIAANAVASPDAPPRMIAGRPDMPPIPVAATEPLMSAPSALAPALAATPRPAGRAEARQAVPRDADGVPTTVAVVAFDPGWQRQMNRPVAVAEIVPASTVQPQLSPAFEIGVMSQRLGAVEIGIDGALGDLRVSLGLSPAAAAVVAADTPRLIADLAASGVRLQALDVVGSGPQSSSFQTGNYQGDSFQSGGFHGGVFQGGNFQGGGQTPPQGQISQHPNARAAPDLPHPTEPPRLRASDRYA